MGKSCVGTALDRFASPVRKVKQVGLLVPMLSVVTLLNAQMPSQGSDDRSSDLQQQTTTSQTDSSMPGESVNQPRNANSSANPNYLEDEQLSRGTVTRNQGQRPALLPEPLTEFQKFMASTTGQTLPVFGASLFSSVPSTFAPLDQTPVPQDYVLGPGDELRIHVWGQVNFQTSVRVDRAGDIFLPQVGPVHVAGMTFSALDEHLHGAIGRVYHNFNLTADVGQIRAIQVYVSGQARRPGVYTVSSLSSLVDAIFTSGGPSVQGSMRHIQLRRGNRQVTDFDLYEFLIRGDKAKDAKLESGDVIFIPPVGPQTAVTGSVRNPAIYELRADETLSTLLADAGGVSSVAAEARVSIERIDDHNSRHALEVAYDAAGLQTPVVDGDLVRVFSIVPLYRKTVILRGTTANPGRFAWHAGMHISDLIPDRESLITRNYWWKRAQLGLPEPEFEPTPGFANMRQPVDNHAVTLRRPEQDATSEGQQFGSQQGQYSNQGTNQISNQYPNQNQNQNQNQYPNQNPNQNAQQRAGSSSLATQQTAGSTRFPPSTQRTEISKLAPGVDWNYAAIERLNPETLETVLVPFDLGKLVMQHDASQDLELQPGDVVTIFSEADIREPIAQQSKLITLGGEFAHAGTYTALPGETLRHLVDRAGGLTPNAYLYGSEFTRESTRAIEQARIDEYVQSLSMGIQRSNLAIAASPTSSAQDLASSAASQASQQELIASLKLTRSAGRIVLKLKPDASGTNSLPGITLEDGDRLLVPPVPATINVVGAVYNQNSFLYTRGQRAGAYIRLAGGPNRTADRSQATIIRADGEVVGHQKGGTIWSGSEFAKLPMNPGDTIVVPEKTLGHSPIRELLDWTGVFSQMALGVAAISLLQ